MENISVSEQTGAGRHTVRLRISDPNSPWMNSSTWTLSPIAPYYTVPSVLVHIWQQSLQRAKPTPPWRLSSMGSFGLCRLTACRTDYPPRCNCGRVTPSRFVSRWPLTSVLNTPMECEWSQVPLPPLGVIRLIPHNGRAATSALTTATISWYRWDTADYW